MHKNTSQSATNTQHKDHLPSSVRNYMTTRKMSEKEKTKSLTETQNIIKNYTTAVQNTPPSNKTNKPNQSNTRDYESHLWDSKADYLLDIKTTLREVVKEELTQKFAEYEKALDSMNADITDLRVTQKSKEEKIDSRIVILEKEITSMNLTNTQLQGKLTKLEALDKQRNLKFFNVMESRSKTNEQLIYEALNFVGLRIPPFAIVSTERIGSFRGENNPRPVIVKLHNDILKHQIMVVKQALKQQCKITVVEDLPEEIEKNRNLLYKIFKETKAHHQAKLYDDYLVINGRKFTDQNTHALPTELQPHNLATKEINNTIAFYKAFSFFSNHHNCEFIIEGKKFTSVEQFYMYKKAKYFNDDVNANKIMATANPVLQKNYGMTISNFKIETWREVQDQIMKTGIQAKFEQNEILKEKLLQTGEKTLVEANPYDRYWSCGLQIIDSDIDKPAKYKGKNMLGKLLMELRGELSNS